MRQWLFSDSIPVTRVRTRLVFAVWLCTWMSFSHTGVRFNCTCITDFCTFLCRRCTTTVWKCLNWRFVKAGNTGQQLSFSIPELWYSPLEFNYKTFCQDLTNWTRWNKRYKVWSIANSLFKWRFRSGQLKWKCSFSWKRWPQKATKKPRKQGWHTPHTSAQSISVKSFESRSPLNA